MNGTTGKFSASYENGGVSYSITVNYNRGEEEKIDVNLIVLGPREIGEYPWREFLRIVYEPLSKACPESNVSITCRLRKRL